MTDPHAALVLAADLLHKLALARINTLMDAEAGSPEMEELSSLAEAVQAYERERFTADLAR